MKKISLTFVSTIFMAFLLGTPTPAASTTTWSGTTADWNTVGNWSPLIPTSIYNVGLNGNGSAVIDINSLNASAFGVVFSGTTAYDITSSGGTLNLTTAGTITSSSTAAQTIYAPIVIGAAAGAATYTFGNSSPAQAAPLIFDGTITGFGGSGTTALTLTGPTNGIINQLNGVVSDGSGGADPLRISMGLGTWNITGANTFSGGFTLSGSSAAGTVLQIGNNAALGTGALTYSNGTISAVNAPVTISNNITATVQTVVFGGTANLTVNGTTTLASVGGSGTDGVTDGNLGVLTLGAVNLSQTTGTPAAPVPTIAVGSEAHLVLNGVVANGNTPLAGTLTINLGLNSSLALNGNNTFGTAGGSSKVAFGQSDGAVVTFGTANALGNSASWAAGGSSITAVTYFEAAPGGVTIGTAQTAGGVSFNGANNLTLSGTQSGFGNGGTSFILGTGTLGYTGAVQAPGSVRFSFDDVGNLSFGTSSVINMQRTSFNGPGTVTLAGSVGTSITGGAAWATADFFGGTAILDYSVNTSVVAALGTIGGVTFKLQNGTGGNQVYGATMTVGQSTVENVSGASTSEILQLGGLAAKTGEGINFVVDSSLSTPSTVATTTRANAAGIMGGDATVTDSTGTYWAVANGATTAISAYKTVNILNGTTDAASTNYTLTNNSTSITPGGETINSLNFNPADSSGDTLNLAGNLQLASGGLLFNGANNGVISGPGTLSSSTAGRDIYLQDYATGSNTLTINSVIADNGTTNLTKNGPGKLVLGANNTYAGQTYINQGTVSIASDTNLNAAVTGSVTVASVSGASVTLSAAPPANLVVGSSFMGSTVTAISGSTVTLASAYTGSATTGSSVVYATDQAVNLDGGTLEYSATSSGALAQAGTTDAFDSSAPAASRAVNLYSNGGTFQVDTAGVTLTVSGIIANANAVAQNSIGALTKTGAGTLLLSGANTYSGGTTIQAGILQLGNAKALGATESYNTVNVNGGTLDLNGFTAVTSTVTLNGGSIVNTGGTAALNSYGYNLQNGTVSAVLGNDGANAAPVNKNSDGTASGGTVTLSAANTYTGVTNVNAGILAITNTSGSGTGSGALNVNGGGTFAGTGSSASTNFNVVGSSTSARANVLVGQVSANDTNTTGVLTMKSSGTAMIADANLTFNLNAAVAGDVGSDPVNSGNELAVGNTAIQFGTDANSVLLTLNLQNGNVASTTPYVLIAGTLVGDSAATSQYANLTLGTSTGSLATGLMTQILNTSGSGPLTVNFGNVSASAYANSELFLYQDSTTGVDDIVLELVPEPSTWALMLGGMGVLAFCLRRKNQRA